MKWPIALGVNIDHVATLRQARRARYPDPVHAALLAEQAGADAITVHLREDRRHIQDADVFALKERLQTRMNFEMAVTDEMLAIARRLSPSDACFVPERRAEVTTEGGLDVAGQVQRLREACALLDAQGIRVALFVDPDPQQIEAAAQTGAPAIELHTGAFCDAPPSRKGVELERVRSAARLAASLGIEVHAGHGLHYHNVAPIAATPEVVELNIGHSIVARAVFTGLEAAVREMKALMLAARS